MLNNSSGSRRPQCIIITGPTGVGKSSFAEQLAMNIGGEIINGDMGQLYEPFTIGTAKPDLSKVEIPHHLFNEVTTPVNYTAAQYRKRIEPLIADIRARGKMPIIVGGSGFYLSGLFFQLQENRVNTHSSALDLPSVSDNLLPREDMWKKLAELDPERAKKIHPHDIYRLERALRICQHSGTIASGFEPEFNPIQKSFLLIHVGRTREELYQRINERTKEMLFAGWIDEVAVLTDEWKKFVRAKKLIGYPEILDYLENKIPDQKTLVHIIQQNTRRYAKRQIIFWRMFKKKIEQFSSQSTYEIDLTLSSIDLYIKQLLAGFSL